jgi:hypothetical protein
MATIIWIGIVIYGEVKGTCSFQRGEVLPSIGILCVDLLNLGIGMAIYHYFIAGACYGV